MQRVDDPARHLGMGLPRLADHGDIGQPIGRVTLLDQTKLGLNLTVYSAIRTHKHTAEWFDGFYKMVSGVENVMEVHRLSGDIDYLIRAVVPDMQSYDEMYKEMIAKVDLYDVSSSFSMERLKYTTALPLHHL